ncbi:hypothetical protein ACUSIJ_02905 [Pseudochelatococcus sp. B33]
MEAIEPFNEREDASAPGATIPLPDRALVILQLSEPECFPIERSRSIDHNLLQIKALRGFYRFRETVKSSKVRGTDADAVNGSSFDYNCNDCQAYRGSEGETPRENNPRI